MYKKSYKLEPVYIKFNDDITGIRKSVECYNNNFNNELAKIKKYYTNIEENNLDDYEFEKFKIQDDLHTNLSNTIIHLYRTFEIRLKELLKEYNIQPGGIIYQPYLEFVKTNLNIELPHNFENDINKLRKIRNKYVHNNTDPEISNEELTQFILYMTEKISTFFNSIMATIYKT